MINNQEETMTTGSDHILMESKRYAPDDPRRWLQMTLPGGFLTKASAQRYIDEHNDFDTNTYQIVIRSSSLPPHIPVTTRLREPE